MFAVKLKKMKKYRVITSVFLGISLIACNPKVPEVVLNSFASQFANAENVKWSKEGKSEYEVEFMLGSTKMSANYDKEGNCAEVEKQIDISSAPSFINEILTEKYAGYTIDEIESNEKPGKSLFYEVEIKKGSSEDEIFISSEGKLLENEPDED